MENVKKVSIIGFIFGIVFIIAAYIGDFYVYKYMLLGMPFFISLLCVLGTVVANFTNNRLVAKGYTNEKGNLAVSFLAAAFVNVAIVILVLATFGITNVQREVVIGSGIGLLMGAVYGIYRFQVDTLNEKMKFLEELSEKNKQLQEASRQLAIIEERNRMGRELHDTVSQGLHGLVFSLHSLRNEWKEPSDRASAIMNHMEATAKSTLDELRTMIEELKPSLLVEQGLKDAVKTTFELFSQRTNIQVKITLEVPEYVPPDVEMAIYRVTQEALANIEKHAAAEHVVYSIHVQHEQLIVTIQDDGIGFVKEKHGKGNGLENIRQRVEDSDGILNIISKPGRGTTILMKFPQKAES
ncbi:MAG: sensor histidine kinase [Bacillus sp. (in: Bacteria)]|nr:sensor histidine kinase [Bacillus sp. (in: firmicutes)]